MTEDRRVPLSAERHGNRFWRRFASYDFARGRRTVPLALDEVEPVAASMPVLFAETPEGIGPVALLRLVPGGDCAFVSPAGLWLAAYVPSLLRVHPFSAEPLGDRRMQLMVDEGSGLVTGDPGDEPFFGADGQPAPTVAELVGFFIRREAAAQKGRAAAARLRALGLLDPFAPTGIDAPEGAWAGLWTVDRARFEALPDDVYLELRGMGAVGLVHAHRVSLGQLPWLARAEAARDAAAAAPRAPEAQGGVSDFLDALAAAQAGEPVLPDSPPPTRERRH